MTWQTIGILNILDHKQALFSPVSRPPFEFWTFWQPDTNLTFEYWTSPVFRWLLYTIVSQNFGGLGATTIKIEVTTQSEENQICHCPVSGNLWNQLLFLLQLNCWYNTSTCPILYFKIFVSHPYFSSIQLINFLCWHHLCSKFFLATFYGLYFNHQFFTHYIIQSFKFLQNGLPWSRDFT